MSFMFRLLHIARHMLAEMVCIINVTYCIHISRIFLILNKPCTKYVVRIFPNSKEYVMTRSIKVLCFDLFKKFLHFFLDETSVASAFIQANPSIHRLGCNNLYSRFFTSCALTRQSRSK